MKILPSVLAAGCLLAQTAFATVSMTVTVNPSVQDGAMPASFTGASFETGSLLYGNAGVSGYLFNSGRTDVINLFKNMGLKSLRIGGGSVDAHNTAIPGITSTGAGGTSDGWTPVDDVFDFAGQAGVSIIYSLRLLSTSETDEVSNVSNDTTIASHIWGRNQAQLGFFAIGNEPDWHNPYHNGSDPEIATTTAGQPEPVTAYTTYSTEWREFAGAASPSTSAAFGGPDTGDNTSGTFLTDGRGWTQAFTDDKISGLITQPITAALQHDYVGGSATGVTTQTAIDAMLSTTWLTTNYQGLWNRTFSPVAVTDGWNYRITECNDYTGGVDGASNGMASALWALDYMHWQIAKSKHCLGVNFHCKQDSTLGTGFKTTSLIYFDTTSGAYKAYPKACAVKAYNLANTGNRITSLTVSNPSNANVTVYANGAATDFYLTIINKTHQTTYTDAAVTINKPTNFTPTHASYIVLDSVPANTVTATDATIGGAHIDNTGTWAGTWNTLTVTNGQCSLTVHGVSAVVVHIWL
jgi:hypothetical protein